MSGGDKIQVQVEKSVFAYFFTIQIAMRLIVARLEKNYTN